MSYSYEALSTEAYTQGVDVLEKNLRGRNKGLYGDGVILLDKRISTIVEKACILAEELGHFHTSSGNILDQKDIRNRKQELRARQWAYQCMIPLDRIVQAHHVRVSGRYDLAEYLGITEEFLQAAIDRFTEKYGLSVKADDRHIVVFNPLGVIELFPES
ncbi:ImmA/IrrE family metallo-endopeptidase [Paenibacillus kribbensis]|uniref:ImmA/IrrE family metallo-endopeptidase n=1 Tax=Paenibacillus kribbensis TaxID=172713 RepID=UPI002DB9E2E5|nr:ImmA/IrrE family metallo-endopeptidase [Paenibacillus kribbensis]MEC0234424.1 ImmA/IrrE family metallo-endopeptidase [Paenibacillus kribbensis]